MLGRILGETISAPESRGNRSKGNSQHESPTAFSVSSLSENPILAAMNR